MKKYFIKLMDNEKLEINLETYERLKYGMVIDTIVTKGKMGWELCVPLRNIKLFYVVEVKGGK